MNKQEILKEFDIWFPEKRKMCLVDGYEETYCIIDDGRPDDCTQIKKGMKKEDCEYWDDVSIKYQPIKIKNFISDLIDQVEEEKKELIKALLELDCGDNSCLFSSNKGGMRTNGGCRCLKEFPTKLQLAIKRIYWNYKKELKDD